MCLLGGGLVSIFETGLYIHEILSALRYVERKHLSWSWRVYHASIDATHGETTAPVFMG